MAEHQRYCERNSKEQRELEERLGNLSYARMAETERFERERRRLRGILKNERLQQIKNKFAQKLVGSYTHS